MISKLDEECLKEFDLVNQNAKEQIDIIPIIGGRGLHHYRLNSLTSRPMFFEQHKSNRLLAPDYLGSR